MIKDLVGKKSLISTKNTMQINKCNHCNKSYNGTRYQRWCNRCRDFMRNINDSETYEDPKTIAKRRGK